jgi:hypothetical protein
MYKKYTWSSAMTNVESRVSATLFTALTMSKVVAESRPFEIESMNLMGFGLQIISPT